MKFSTLILALALLSSSAVAFTGPASRVVTHRTSELGASAVSADVEELQRGRLIHDPLSLYPQDSPERLEHRIRPLEAAGFDDAKTVVDPLGLYGAVGATTADLYAGETTMSRSLPFASRPAYLDGTMAGDAGFDPLGLASCASFEATAGRLAFMREAEVKHGRLAMLGAAGWIAAEALGEKVALLSQTARPLLQWGDRVPSVLNGGLGRAVEPFFPIWMGAVAVAGGIEIIHAYDRRSNPELYADRSAGDFGFDPFNMYNIRGNNASGRRAMEESELKHGRIAMLAVAAFVFQEAFTGIGVVPQLISLTHPFGADYLAAEGFGSNIEAVLAGAVL